jgi:hypothetical protein
MWIDHQAYRQQRHKQCAFNLYAAAVLETARQPTTRSAMTPAPQPATAGLRRAVKAFWSA